MSTLLQYRFVLVIALLAIAAALLRNRNGLPLALRGISRVTGGPSVRPQPVSRLRRTFAFLLVVLAFALAVWSA